MAGGERRWGAGREASRVVEIQPGGDFERENLGSVEIVTLFLRDAVV